MAVHGNIQNMSPDCGSRKQFENTLETCAASWCARLGQRLFAGERHAGCTLQRRVEASLPREIGARNVSARGHGCVGRGR